MERNIMVYVEDVVSAAIEFELTRNQHLKNVLICPFTVTA